MRRLLPTHAFMFFSAVLLLVLLVLSVGTYWWQAKNFQEDVIAEHITELVHFFNEIDKQCGIIDFEHQRNYIDFLTVESFVGSEVGSMNLKYPDRWQGPYLEDNPTMQEKYYEIVYTHKGYFIVPGEGVKLADGRVIGEDIIFTPETDIQELIDDGDLMKDGKPLAAKISVSG